MQQVTVVLFSAEELYHLTRVRPFIGIAAPDGPPDERGRHRSEWERRWNAVCQSYDLISHEAITRGLDYAQQTRGRCQTESQMNHWQHIWADEIRAAGLDPGDQVFPTQMAEYITAIRANMVPDLDKAISILYEALDRTTPKPANEKYEDL